LASTPTFGSPVKLSFSAPSAMRQLRQQPGIR
jgi:hypothetical protein